MIKIKQVNEISKVEMFFADYLLIRNVKTLRSENNISQERLSITRKSRRFVANVKILLRELVTILEIYELAAAFDCRYAKLLPEHIPDYFNIKLILRRKNKIN